MGSLTDLQLKEEKMSLINQYHDALDFNNYNRAKALKCQLVLIDKLIRKARV